MALLAALIAVQAVGRGESLAIDPARLAGLGAAWPRSLLRAPFLVVILAAAGTAAALRAAGHQLTSCAGWPQRHQLSTVKCPRDCERRSAA